jgi:DNA polymerase IV (DinB-like DNA polymerase)
LPEKIGEFLESMKIRNIPGIGKKTEERFFEMNFQTIKELKKLDVFSLNKEFGRKSGTYIFNAIRGIDKEPVQKREQSTQYSKVMTLKNDSLEFEFILESLKKLCGQVHEIILNEKKMFKYIGIQLIQSDLSNKTKSKSLKKSTANLEELEKNVEQLLKEALGEQKITIRRVGVKVSELSEVKDQSSITSYF